MSGPRLVIAVLAAGGSSRLGRLKQLEPIAGEPLIHRQARIALEADVGTVGVVLGHAAEACAQAILDLPIELMANDRWADGMSSSLRIAVHFARRHESDGLMILLGDQYGIRAIDLRTIADAWIAAGAHATVATRVALDAGGPPAIFPRAGLDALAALTGDIGARRLLACAESLTLVEIEAARLDLDDEDDAASARASTR